MIGHRAPPKTPPLNALLALASRDVHVVFRAWRPFLVRVALQPFLFVFAFTYVFPKVGQVVGGSGAGADFSTLLVPGTIATSSFLQALLGITVPMVSDLGFTREIEDRALAPIPRWTLAVAKIASGAIEGLAAGLVVLPIAAIVPTTDVHLEISPLLPFALVLTAISGAALGLALGTSIKVSQLQQIGAFVLPITFLGASYYPWEALDAIRWLQYLVLVNPLVYCNEILRAALSPSIDHMSPWISFPAVIAITLACAAYGARRLQQRITG